MNRYHWSHYKILYQLNDSGGTSISTLDNRRCIRRSLFFISFSRTIFNTLDSLEVQSEHTWLKIIN